MATVDLFARTHHSWRQLAVHFLLLFTFSGTFGRLRNMICKNGRAMPNLHEAAFVGDIREATQALENGQGATSLDDTGTTAMHKAAANGHLDIIKLLIQHGGDLDQVDVTGCSPLHAGARNGHLACVTYLVEQGANFRLKSNKGNSPMNVAKTNAQQKVAEYLTNCDREKFAWEVV